MCYKNTFILEKSFENRFSCSQLSTYFSNNLLSRRYILLTCEDRFFINVFTATLISLQTLFYSSTINRGFQSGHHQNACLFFVSV